jgi:uncharacterized membrane protein
MLNTDGVIMTLGRLNGSDGSVGLALNNSAQVMGWSFTSHGNFVTHNFLYSGGKVTDQYPFGLANPLVAQSNVINSSGEVAGHTTTDSTTLSVIYNGGTLTTLGTLPCVTSSVAFGINDNGDVTGSSLCCAFRHKNGAVQNIGQVGTSATEGRLINNNDRIAGTAIKDHTPLFLYSNDVMTPITPISGTSTTPPMAINSSGVIVGDSTEKIAKVVKTIPFISFGGSAAINLNTLLPTKSGWVLTTATGIDNHGHVSGVGSKNDGTAACYLMTPN